MRSTLALLSCVLATGPQIGGAQVNLGQALDATVTISVDGGRSSGSGFLVSGDGLLVTAAHVIEGAVAATVQLRGGGEFPVEGVVFRDRRLDLAIIRISGLELPTIEFGDSDGLDVGQRIYVVGAPLGLSSTVSDGLVSQLRSVDGTRLIQISAPVSPGSSGGPVVTEAGRVVGVVVSGVRGGGAENLNFALPSNYVRGEVVRAAQSATSPLGSPGLRGVRDSRDLDRSEGELAGVNAGFRFNWDLLDGVVILTRTNLEGPNRQLDRIAYSVGRTPDGDRRLLRTVHTVAYQTEDRWWSGRPHLEWWRAESRSYFWLDRERYEFVGRIDPVSSTGEPPWRDLTILLEDGRFVRIQDGARESVEVNPGVLPRELIYAALAVADSIATEATLWALDPGRSTVEEVRVVADTVRVQRRVRVPREGSVCERDTPTELRSIETFRRTVRIGTEVSEQWVLANPPRVPVLPDAICMAIPASGLKGR